MCLLKVYLDNGGDKRFVAEDVALIVKGRGCFKLFSLELKEEVVLNEVEVSLEDTLNSVMILKPKKVKRRL